MKEKLIKKNPRSKRKSISNIDQAKTLYDKLYSMKSTHEQGTKTIVMQELLKIMRNPKKHKPFTEKIFKEARNLLKVENFPVKE